MLKNARNALCHLGCFVDQNNQLIERRYFQMLNAIQNDEGLKLGNKISSAHVYFQRNKMKLRLAAQLFSSSVADALEFLMHCGGCDAFKNAGATIQFIHVIDKLFDLLNSRNSYGKSYKQPLRLSKRGEWIDTINRSVDYLSALKGINGQLLLCHRRKAFVVGFITAAFSARDLALELLCAEEDPYLQVLSGSFGVAVCMHTRKKWV